MLDTAIREGATTVNIPDTVGYSMPLEFEQLIRNIRNNVANIDKVIIAAHCHNDLGLGVACSLAGVRAGVRQLECTINGIGERAGNAALEELAMALKTRGEFYGCDIGLDTRQLTRTSKLVSSLTGVEVQPNKAIVGQNAFLHSVGHTSAWRAGQPQDVSDNQSRGRGRGQGRNSAGQKLSGKHAFEEHLKKRNGLSTSRPRSWPTRSISSRTSVRDRKKDVSDRDIEALLDKRISEIPDVYTLESYQAFAGNKLTATATITLKHDGKDCIEAAVGTGSVDACFKAIDRLVKLDVALDSDPIKAVTEGADALGEVTVRIKHGENTYLGKAVSTDVVESSIPGVYKRGQPNNVRDDMIRSGHKAANQADKGAITKTSTVNIKQARSDGLSRLFLRVKRNKKPIETPSVCLKNSLNGNFGCRCAISASQSST